MGERQFCRSVLRIAMAQICQELGWHAIQTTPCDLMTDILQRYIQRMATITHQYAEHYGRTEPNLDDLGLAFQHLGVSLYELKNYIRDVDPIPFKHDIPRFPLPRKNDLQHPEPGSREDRERLQYIPAYLPPIIGSDDFGAPIAHRDSMSSIPGTPMETDSPESRHLTPGVYISPRGEKREMASPLFSEQAMKRLRLDGDGTPQELTAVSIGLSGELTPKRAGKLPIATTPPQRLLKTLTHGTEIPAGKASKAITDGFLSRSEETMLDRLGQPKSPKGGRTPGVQQKSPKSQLPGTPKHSMFSTSKYPQIKTKSGGTPSGDDKPGVFQYPPPKSPKALSSSNKKQPETLTKKEKKAFKVFEFDDDEFDSKPSRDPLLSPSESSRPYKEPSAFLESDNVPGVKTSSSESTHASIDDVIARVEKGIKSKGVLPSIREIKVKKIDKEKRKSISKDKSSKGKAKLKNKKSKENTPSYYDSVGSTDKKISKGSKKKVSDSSSSDKKSAAKLVIKTERQSSSDGEIKAMKKKFKKAKEKDKSKELKVKKLKQKSIEYKNKSKAAKRGVSPTAIRPQDDSSPEKRREPIGKFSLIKSAGSGSKLQFKIARPTSEHRDFDDKEKSKKHDKTKKSTDSGKPKVKRLKSRSGEADLSSDKEKKASAKKKSVTKKGQKDSVKKEKDKEEKVLSTPTVPKITFKFGGTPAGGDSPKVSIKTSLSPPPSPSTPRTVPKLVFNLSAKKGKESIKASSKVVSSTPKSETKVKKESKTKGDANKPKKEPKAEAEPEPIKRKAETKTKTESKTKAETKSRGEAAKTKAELKLPVFKKRDRDSDWEESESEKEKEKRGKKDGKKEKSVKEKEKEKPAKVKEEVKPKAEVSPYDFDAPSPPPAPRAKREPSTPSRREPPPGIFAPSVPSPPPQSSPASTKSSPRSTGRSSSAASSPAPTKSKQKASAPPPTPPPTKAALKALPPSATKGAKKEVVKKETKKEKASSHKKKAPLSPPPAKAEPPPPEPPKSDEPCSLIMETVGTVVNEDGEKIWYCPGCRQPDDGVKPMVGCDGCDDWYHWTCVGLDKEPEGETWYCVKCQKKSKKKRGKKV